ncbi:MAG: M14-type cytosolic carboxypeptidase [Pirellulales bacterium]|nr:M14-type cytosolic carboxypeptidase [Pirellulales bacterium]
MMRIGFAVAILVFLPVCQSKMWGAEELVVQADFEGASVRVLEVDQSARSVRFAPGGDPARGWPCWWYFRLDGIDPGETITLNLRGSTASLPGKKPLSSAWAMPRQASYSTDGETWRHSEPGQRTDHWMVYTIKPESSSMWVAWGPPYTPEMATRFVAAMSEHSPHAHRLELCQSREGRSVPMLHIHEGDRAAANRFGVWVQARQHAWESGSSWVAHGFAEWLLSDNEDAAWLRQHADIFLVPVMDVDNAATGNGGKNALPHDHNRDWSSEPHWNEIKAAQHRVGKLIDEGRMDVFLDLHNPAPGDPSFFYILPEELLQEPAIRLRNRFIELAYQRISKIKPLMPMSNKPKVTGAGYHPLWRQISSNWVSMNGNPHTVSLCLETAWNYKNSNTTGYQAVGANLAAAVRDYLGERR